MAKNFHEKKISLKKKILKTILFDKIRGKKFSWQKNFAAKNFRDKIFFEINTIRQNSWQNFSWQKNFVAKNFLDKNFF